MNDAMSRPLPPTMRAGEDREKDGGLTALATSPIDIAMLMMKPVWVSIIRAPAPIPRFSGGTTPMTALVFGEMNRPDPAPMISCQTASCQYGVSTAMVVNRAGRSR